LFVIVGDKGRHQAVNLHYILSKASVKARPSVLWCYKKELGFSSHKQKRMKQLKNAARRSVSCWRVLASVMSPYVLRHPSRAKGSALKLHTGCSGVHDVSTASSREARGSALT
jgi:hypothetical protein